MYLNCMCSDPDCRINGCKLAKQARENEQPQIKAPYVVYSAEPLPKGCICPPGSEATCQRSDCGRKDYSFKIGL